MATVTAHQSETLDALCYRVFGHTDHLEALYDLNPGIEEQGAWLPAGTPVTVPDISASDTTDRTGTAVAVNAPANTIKLWD